MSDELRRELAKLRIYKALELRVNEARQLVDQDGVPFNLVNYSKFKYGLLKIAYQYGVLLAEELILAYPEITNSRNSLVITSAPYKHIPKAAAFIAEAVCKTLRTHRDVLMLSAPRCSRISRATLVAGDYSQRTFANRIAISSNSSLSCDEQVFRDSNVIVIDDLMVSGASLLETHNFLKKLPLNSVLYAFVAQITSNDVSLEADLNAGYVTDAQSFLAIFSEGDVGVNQRAAKSLLSLPPEELRWLLPQLPPQYVHVLRAGIVDDGLSIMPLYKQNSDIILGRS